MGHAVERGLTVHQQHFIRRTAGGRGTRREDVPRRSRARTSLGGIGRRRGDASCQAGSGWAATRSPSGGSDVRRGWGPAAPGESDEAVHLFIVRIGLPYLSCKSVEGSRARRSRSGSAPGSVRWRGARMSGATSRACPHEAGIPARVRRRRRRTRGGARLDAWAVGSAGGRATMVATWPRTAGSSRSPGRALLVHVSVAGLTGSSP